MRRIIGGTLAKDDLLRRLIAHLEEQIDGLPAGPAGTGDNSLVTVGPGPIAVPGHC